MKYDFDEIVQRRGTNSYKWDGAEDDVLPMWVADMDFRTAQPIIDAISRRVAHGIFGYVRVPDAYYDALISWFSRKHGWTMERKWVIYTSGVVPALSAIIKAMTKEGDQVIVQTPVYNCFFSSIRNNGCEIVCNSLKRVGDTYRMDFDDLERKTANPKAKVFVLCNPHNPVGRVWTCEELNRVGDICIKNDVFVIADEIHCELVAPDYEYTPFASISNDFLIHSATCTSPSKAFNIAGLQIANIAVKDDGIRNRIDKAININEVCDVNPLGVEALIAAYNKGEEWLKQMRTYIYANYDYMHEYCAKHLPQFPIAKLEGTYLVWMDCKALAIKSDRLEEELIKKAKLWLNAGSMYGKDGEGYMRWNIACPRSVLEEGLRRFVKYIGNFR